MSVEFRNYTSNDYDRLCNYFVECNAKKESINWNWARFEWMYFHSEFDSQTIDSIGLWVEGDRIVAAAVYDMYFGEAYCGTLEGYEYLYQDVVGYATECLSDESGCGIAICDTDELKKKAVQDMGFTFSAQDENIMTLNLDIEYSVSLPEHISICTFNPADNPREYQWLMWQGFDHGNDVREFEDSVKVVEQKRPHMNEQLCLVAKNLEGEIVAHVCCWYLEGTDYAYIEPVFTLPNFRNRGLARGLIYECCNRVSNMGAKKAYVISDQEFFAKLGFENEMHFTFWWI